MMTITRRFLLAGATASVLLAAAPSYAQQGGAPPQMPEMRMIETNGIELAVYEAGTGPTVVLLHGFPGLAYTWRHQIPVLVAAGYHVVAPDLRGYGQSDTPEAVEDYDIQDLTGDLEGLLDNLDVEKAVFMGHDWGGMLAWQMALLHEDRTAGVVALNTPHVPNWMLWLHNDIVDFALPDGAAFLADPRIDPIEQMRDVYSPNMYVVMFQDGLEADAVMNADVSGTLRGALRKDLGGPELWPQFPVEARNMEHYGFPAPDEFAGQDVLNAEELAVYVKNFERTGFTPGINWYRNISRNWQSTLDVDQTVEAPSLMIAAENDVVLRASMTEGMVEYVPDLETHVVQDVWHWTPEEKPEAVNAIVIDWLERRFPS